MSLAGVVSPDGRTVVVVGSTPTEAQVVLHVDAGRGPVRADVSTPPPVAVGPGPGVTGPRPGR